MTEQYPPTDYQNSLEEHEKSTKSFIEISEDRLAAIIIVKEISLDDESPVGPTVDIRYTREPNKLEPGDIISYTGARPIRIDEHETQIRNLSSQAELLRSLEPKDRPRALLELMSEHVSFAYPSVLEKLHETDPDEAAWLKENISLEGNSHAQISLSEIVHHGYGICAHLSPLYLWLAQKAGLEGVLTTHAQKKMTNVTRRDNNEPLFKSVAIGQPVADHMWVEIYLQNGERILVDPSTRLVGDTPENLQTIADAGYASGDGFLLEGRRTDRDGIDTIASSVLTPAGSSDFSQRIQTQLSASRTPASFAEKFPSKYPASLTGDVLIAIGGAERKGFGRFLIKDISVS